MIVVADSLNMDLVGTVPRLPAWGETVLGDAFARHPGGKGGNQAVAAARLGAPVAMAAAVGDDAFGAELRAGLAAEGIDVAAVCSVAAATGCALIHVGPQGDNAISVLPGANRQAPPPPAAWPAAWRLLLLQLEVPLTTTLAWAHAARASGATVMLNAAPMAALPDELLAATDVLVVNQVELQALAGADGADSGRALAAVAERGPRCVVVTLGERGCEAWDDGMLLSLPARVVSVVDTTGAGDTFVGALAAARWQGLPLSDALARANSAAAMSCTRPGARGGMPTAAELETWMNR